MTAEPPIEVEILARVTHVSGQVRAIARTKDDRYAVGSVKETPEGVRFAPITPYVSFGDVQRTAENIIAGDPRATTWPPAHLVLALGVVVIADALAASPQEAGSEATGKQEDQSSAEPPASGRSVPADDAAAPGHEPGAAAEPSEPSPRSPSREGPLHDHLPYQHSLGGALEQTLKPSEAT